MTKVTDTPIFVVLGLIVSAFVAGITSWIFLLSKIDERSSEALTRLQAQSPERFRGPSGPPGPPGKDGAIGPPGVPGAPPGTIISFAGPNKPAGGWLPCNGDALRSADFPKLYEAIGKSWGDGSTDGDPSTPRPASADFNIPDLRGVFLRGEDTGQDKDWLKDPDRDSRKTRDGAQQANGVGSYQRHYLETHDHALGQEGDHIGFVGLGPIRNNMPSSIPPVGNDHSTTVIPRTRVTGGKENRPTNAAVLFIIKAE